MMRRRSAAWSILLRLLALSLVPRAPSPAAADAVCGDGLVEADEECDDGGICIGGANAGTHCTAESQCQGNGVCVGGAHAERGCAADSACPGGKCVRCRRLGGNGCAANCTAELDVPINLVAGAIQEGTMIAQGTSGAVIHGDILTIPLPISGTETLTIGKPRNGTIPAVVKARSVFFPPIPVNTLACACVRGIPRKTCGGTLFGADGTPSHDCTPEFTAGDSVCAATSPCTFVHGGGNALSGIVGCEGLENVDYDLTQDGGGVTGTPSALSLVLGGSGGPGSALFFSTTAIGVAVGLCDGSDPIVYGADGQFCTADDPQSTRGTPSTLPLTTGTATGSFSNANLTPDDTIGPLSVSGIPLDCDALQSGHSPTGALAGVSLSLGQPTIGDIVVTTLLVLRSGPPDTPTATRTATPVLSLTPTPTLRASPVPLACVGDCGTDGTVTIDELIRGVSIALGTVPPADCPAFDVNHDGAVTMDELIAAVNGALLGCRTGVPSPTPTAYPCGVCRTQPCATLPPGCTRPTATRTPTKTCTPGSNPAPGCAYEGPTFTATASPHTPPRLQHLRRRLGAAATRTNASQGMQGSVCPQAASPDVGRPRLPYRLRTSAKPMWSASSGSASPSSASSLTSVRSDMPVSGGVRPTAIARLSRRVKRRSSPGEEPGRACGLTAGADSARRRVWSSRSVDPALG